MDDRKEGFRDSFLEGTRCWSKTSLLVSCVNKEGLSECFLGRGLGGSLLQFTIEVFGDKVLFLLGNGTGLLRVSGLVVCTGFFSLSSSVKLLEVGLGGVRGLFEEIVGFSKLRCKGNVFDLLAATSDGTISGDSVLLLEKALLVLGAGFGLTLGAFGV